MKTLAMLGMLIFGLALSVHTVLAGEQTLATVTRSDNGGALRFSARLTEVNDLTGLSFVTSSTRIDVTMNEIDGRSKVVYRSSGQDVLSIKATNFSVYAGGTLELVYLQEYNIMSSNTYRKLTLNLDRDGDTWSLSKDGRKVTGLKLNIYRWGISSIDVFYAK